LTKNTINFLPQGHEGTKFKQRSKDRKLWIEDFQWCIGSKKIGWIFSAIVEL